ncbi:hypothetical protein RhiirC2_708976 [Rhizophagus irregularis]|uniref:Uncharacterized protein n=1 Tax=Rhizophagus irregularis TaxID=588596 RepID=A0A2N1NKB0_9GLOM|nr:hypothetical protein RhiirC2_708976 [Rhizophagus irregularis]
MPAIDKALKDRIIYNQTELKYVLQQLHHHRRESWQISQNVEKVKEDKKRKGTNSRRSDKKERRKRGLQHMNATNDPIFIYLRPTLLSEKDYKRDIEKLVENGLITLMKYQKRMRKKCKRRLRITSDQKIKMKRISM